LASLKGLCADGGSGGFGVVEVEGDRVLWGSDLSNFNMITTKANNRLFLTLRMPFLGAKWGF